MSEVLIPPWIIPERESQDWIDDGSSVFRAAFAAGLAQRQSYGGLRLKLSRSHTVRGEEKAHLLAALNQTRGQYNVVRTKMHFPNRGTGVGSELLSNGTFASGTSGWTALSNFGLSVNDRLGRLTRSQFTQTADVLATAQTTGLTQYAAYAARSFDYPGQGNFIFGPQLGSASGGEEYGRGNATTFGMKAFGAVIRATTAYYGLVDYDLGPNQAGDFIHVSYNSFARCGIVDNGQNLVTRSDALDNAAWTKNAVTVTADATASLDGTTSADRLVETSANSSHNAWNGAVVSSAAAEYSFCVAIKQDNRSHAYLLLEETGSSTQAVAWFNAATGVVTSTSTGVNWGNVRTYTVALGNGWFYICIVARKTNAATGIRGYVGMSNADGVLSYTGNTANGMYVWRGTLAQSSSPPRLVQTTTAATSGTPQNGGGLYIKGLPESSSGLLLPGDWFEVNGELKQASSALNTDASGRAYLACEPSIVSPPSDGDPVIFTDPMGKFLLSNLKVDNDFGTQARVSYDLEHIYE